MNCTVILHNIRSAHNVGSIFRTADGAGFSRIILTGYTPVPPKKDALHLTRAEKEFLKTALGAGESLVWKKYAHLKTAVAALRKEGYTIVALEQAKGSVDYCGYQMDTDGKVALLVGNEVQGLLSKELSLADTVIEIPMRGKKNSLNVGVAFGIAAYRITR